MVETVRSGVNVTVRRVAQFGVNSFTAFAIGDRPRLEVDVQEGCKADIGFGGDGKRGYRSGFLSRERCDVSCSFCS